MCGIAGYLDLSGRHLDPNQSILNSMCASIHHRGPDDHGGMILGPVALSMTRLSIIDLTTGHQPISNEDGSIWIVFNGEIYNFQELRVKLIAKGHTFKTNSDTEAIVHLYEEYGVDCLQHLEGMFAFALWDSNKERLFIARDRLGEKPLHWGVFDGKLIFGSEIKVLLAHPSTKKELDPASMQKYLALEYVPAPNSIFKGINKLMPAHFLLAEKGQIKTQSYWSPYNKNGNEKLSEGDAEEKLVELLDRSTKLRLISDVPLGVFLSGGVDSSSIAALAQRHLNEPLKTFSIGFADRSFDESEYAEAVAQRVGCDHHVAVFSAEMALATMEDLWKVLDEPMADASIVPTYFLSKMTKEHVTVALSGEGGDELFGGYPTYQAHRLANIWQMIPKALRSGVLEPAIAGLPVSFNNLSVDYKAKRFISAVDQEPVLRHFRWMGSIPPEKQEELIAPEHYRLRQDSEIYPQVQANGGKAKDVIAQIMHTDMTTYLPEDLLVKSDRASMAASLEVRLPFLAYPLVEFAVSLPSSLKVRGLKTKYLLKKAMAPYLPDRILNRPKKGFGIPVARWLRQEFRPQVNELMSEPFLKKQGIFKPEQIKQLLAEHDNEHYDRRKELWTLLMFQMWWRKFFA
jgi:asparagine synthase (glutamine-hydrolysing)